MQDFEQRGSFYLGRKYDLAQRELSAEKVLYDSSDLTTHAVCVGMTGSGKTGLCLSLIEEAALDGIPVIAVDPKGDLGNLLLAFPQLAPGDFQPWIDPTVAQQKGVTVAELAAQTADLWRDGLAKWDEDNARIERFNAAVDKVIYTPGSSAGISMTVLKSFDAPSKEIVADTDLFTDRVQSTTEGVLALLGVNADPVKSREAILIANVFTHFWRAGENLELSSLIRSIQQPRFDKVGLVDLETFMPSADRKELGMMLNNLLAAPSFASWLEGEPLHVDQLLHTPEGKPRLSILSIAHLNDAERMFFVTILLNEVLSWMRTQPGTGNLRAILYMDEVFGYFPPSANPPSKKPMLTLLKQARAFGLGVVLATQNPVDLDYKGLSNAGTWFLGRLQTERDKLRVLEGLEGASAEAGSTFNRNQMEATLAALGNRVFLMNNVHEDRPQVFHTRWAMSYLRGPLTRDQIRQLMDPRRGEFVVGNKPLRSTAAEDASPAAGASPPILLGDIEQAYWPLAEGISPDASIQYRPGIWAAAKLHFVNSATAIDRWQEVSVLQTAHGSVPTPVWNAASVFEHQAHLQDKPLPQARFVEPPTELVQEKNYKQWGKDLADHLYRTERWTLWQCKVLDESSNPGEEEAAFRARLENQARVKARQLVEEEKRSFANRIDKAEQAVRDAETRLKTQRTQFWVRLGEFLMVILDVFSGLLGGKRRSRRQPTTAIGRTVRERGEESRALDRLEDKQQTLDDLCEERDRRIAEIERQYAIGNLDLDKVEITPRKGDIEVGRVKLVWLPWRTGNTGLGEPAW